MTNFESMRIGSPRGQQKLLHRAWFFLVTTSVLMTIIKQQRSSLFCHSFGTFKYTNTFSHTRKIFQQRSLIGSQSQRYQSIGQRLNMASSDGEKAPKKKKAKKAPSKKKSKANKKSTKSSKSSTVDVGVDVEESVVATTKSTVTSTNTATGKFQPSRITDDDEPTPDDIEIEPESITEDEIPGSKFDQNAIPIPHQPWRRGDTDGCEDPIDAPWRVEGEQIIKNAAISVGGVVSDVTWYMAAVVITVDDDSLNQVHGESGPEIRVYDDNEPMWFDPNDPEPEDDYGIYEGEEDGRMEVENEDGSISSGIPNDPYLEREFDEATGTFMPPPKRPTREQAVRNMSREEFEKYINEGMKVEMADRDERVGKLKMSMEDFQLKLEELRATTNLSKDEMEKRAKDLRARYLRSEDLAEYYPEEFENVGNEEALGEKLAMPVLERADGVNTEALSIIANAIVNALDNDDVEDRLEILSRHEIVMTSPGPDNYIETQRDFDANRGKIVNVQTQDPFGSNRVLVGNLVDRNALDVYINVGGRLVTIPLNMVAHVTLSDKNASVEKATEGETVGA
jgi:ribosome maturation factor RimP